MSKYSFKCTTYLVHRIEVKITPPNYLFIIYPTKECGVALEKGVRVGGKRVSMSEAKECPCRRERSVRVGGKGVSVLEGKECLYRRERSVRVGGKGVSVSKGKWGLCRRYIKVVLILDEEQDIKVK